MKGQGADVPIDKTRLSQKELVYLKHIYSAGGVSGSLTARQIQEHFQDSDREASSVLSMLVGMDLIKNSTYRIMLTDSEEKAFRPTDTPRYFVPCVTGEPWTKRVLAVIACEGSLLSLKDMHYNLSLWPRKKPLEYYHPAMVLAEGDRFLLAHEGKNMEVKVMKLHEN